MQHKKTEYFEQIENYINSYKQANGGVAPSTYEIAAELGIGQATAVRYLQVMRANGIVEYDGHRSISTRQSKLETTEYVPVPILGTVACGLPKLAEENVEEYVRLPVSLLGRGSFFALHAKGDSMINAGIEAGDLVIVRRQNTADYNQIVVALVDDEATLKRFRPEGDIIRLHAENPAYDDILLESCLIQGVAVKVIKNLI